MIVVACLKGARLPLQVLYTCGHVTITQTWIAQTTVFRHARIDVTVIITMNANIYNLITPRGHFDLGPPGVKDGDIICNIYGYWWPFLLRKVDCHYVLVGACWVLALWVIKDWM
jgi:hypothetical protein